MFTDSDLLRQDVAVVILGTQFKVLKCRKCETPLLFAIFAG